MTPRLSPQTVRHWTTRGYLRLPLEGSGYHHEWPPEEVRAALAIDSARRLGGVDPTPGSQSPQHHRLRAEVSDAARRCPAGAVVELPCPVPFIRMILVVPTP